MIRFRCIHLSIRSVLFILLSVILNGVHISQTALHENGMAEKVEMKAISIPQRQIAFDDLSQCSSELECSKLSFPCITCNYNTSCVYGKPTNVTCEARETVQCKDNRQFIKQMVCRYCYQTEVYDHTCVQKGQQGCNSVSKQFRTNCTVHSDILCLGNRTFFKNVRCNWTQGYKWSTTLLISITLGGFGVDRFYLGHWQEGIGKLFSFGGIGIWTLIDVILISLHYVGPVDGSLYI